MAFRKFHRWIVASLLLVLLIPFTGQQAKAANNITMVLDGKQLVSDIPPYIMPKVNVTMVPIRVISEGLGAAVAWKQSAKTADISGGGHTITLTSGKKTALVDGASVALDASVQLRGGRVLVPLRFVGEQLGLQVDWDQVARTITLTSSAYIPTEPPAEGGGSSSSQLQGAWISTVYNLDWPTTSSYGKIEQQKQEYSALLDKLQAMGLNAVFVQVRTAGDALYPSDLVPWSKVLTGTQGKDPGYDPLQYMIEETHKRGMQFHAWFNPFRANLDTTTSKLAANHVAVQHPDWVVSVNNQLIINPGIPEARQHIIDVVMEVVSKYDIDGVHLDDYFYPSSGTFNDDDAFKAYNTQGLSKADWRRDNINQFVQQLGQSIHASKPAVQFGISPFGVWRNQSTDPTGSDTKAGVTAYDSMSADVRTWVKQHWIDYVAPQIYWSMSFKNAQYDKLVDWWAQEVQGTGVDLYIGHAPYKLGTAEAGWQSAQEIINQLQYNTKYDAVKGSIFYSAKDLIKNPLGIVQALTAYYQQ
ncbi:family 10 glycosylhydrolase [Paenibacillus favisporus]|uniref:family 10 glycosylhydrolase n=1 Tax=Paenibacillus favisporus TaxID=221028 RepID=UPI003D2C6CBC